MKAQASSAIIWTDGSSYDSFGGWAALVCLFSEEGVEKVPLSGYHYSTTNNAMEMQAVISGLEYVRELGLATIHVALDSNYVMQTMVNKWYLNWIKPEKRPNWDRWTTLIPLVDELQPRWVKIKGHSKLEGDHYNEVVDQLAGEARKRGQEAWQSQVSTASTS